MYKPCLPGNALHYRAAPQQPIRSMGHQMGRRDTKGTQLSTRLGTISRTYCGEKEAGAPSGHAMLTFGFDPARLEVKVVDYGRSSILWPIAQALPPGSRLNPREPGRAGADEQAWPPGSGARHAPTTAS